MESTSLSEQQVMAASQALFVDISVNRAYYLENGILIEKWNVISGRDYNASTTSQAPAADYTPTGQYYIHQIEKCPLFFPRDGSPKGACASDNPLGTRGLWFRSGRLYGLHGTNQPGLFSSADNNRRYSGGCVRNQNSQIEEIFDRIQSRYVKSNSQSSGRFEVYRPRSGAGVPISVGKFRGKYDQVAEGQRFGAGVTPVDAIDPAAKSAAIGKTCQTSSQPVGSQVWVRTFPLGTVNNRLAITGAGTPVAFLDDGVELTVRGYLVDASGVTQVSVDSSDPSSPNSLRNQFGAVFVKADQFANFAQCR